MEGTVDDEEEVCKTEEDRPESIEEDNDDQRTVSRRRITGVPLAVYEVCDSAAAMAAIRKKRNR